MHHSISFVRPLAVSAVLILFCIVFLSPVNAQTCIDEDGDGWGWNGTASCIAGTAAEPTGNQTRKSSDSEPTIALASESPISPFCIIVWIAWVSSDEAALL